MPLLFSQSGEQLFSLAGNAVMLGWLILVFGPRRFALLNTIPAYVIPLVLSLGYTVLIFTQMTLAQGGFDSLVNVALLFESEAMLLAGWVHFLAFDLFIGAWIARQCDERGVSRVIQAPLLLSTFMLGPLGLAIYLIAFAPLPKRSNLSTVPAPATSTTSPNLTAPLAAH